MLSYLFLVFVANTYKEFGSDPTFFNFGKTSIVKKLNRAHPLIQRSNL